jgi:hypothetical protein
MTMQNVPKNALAELAALQLNAMTAADALSLAADLAAQLEPTAEGNDDLSRLQALLLMVRDRAAQVYQQAEVLERLLIGPPGN